MKLRHAFASTSALAAIAIASYAFFSHAAESMQTRTSAATPAQKPMPVLTVMTCKIDRDCGNDNCVDGYCCDTKCEGHCRSCAIPGHLGTCTAVPDGKDPRRACQVSLGGHPACGGACYSGQCAFPDNGTDCGLCSICDGTGRCTKMPVDDPRCGVIGCSSLSSMCRVYQDLKSGRCESIGSCRTISNANCTQYTDLKCNK
jgi:hypothetical protein